jgi:hypothetical protein
MNHQEKRKKARECEKEIEHIKKIPLYLEFKNSPEFNLTEEEFGLLMDGLHEDKRLQEKYNLAQELFTRVAALHSYITYLRQPASKEAHAEQEAVQNPHPDNVLSE